ncbi:putative Alanine racemase [Vibrio nigripulchritudo SOn1]|uniref:Broad specificity amino-acid racemase n=1 Tax=Vibrio nigripulchritudo SOn1 TaxID=1238450 RepID=A0AAV2VKF5_9VIBR|nr:alanine racemase [Vibrio nigripulchritudo]CCO44914.1 putative Alanine racemase [Vibrio nigripulchritudo SOn1]
MKTKLTLLALSLAATTAISTSAVSAPLLSGIEGEYNREHRTSNAWLEVSLSQFNDNIDQFRTHVGSGTSICAVMKADAYGNGIQGLMPTIMAQGIPCVAIASNEEARIVRESGFNGQLIRVRSASNKEIADAIQYEVEELVGSLSKARQIERIAERFDAEINVHLALNSGGMGRNGLDMSTERGQRDALKMTDFDNVEIVGIMTHFPNYEVDYIREKAADFEKSALWIIENSDLDREDVTLHAANSFTSLNVPEAQFDMVRPGGVLYGDLPGHAEYPSIVSYKTKVASLHRLPAGSTVGYDSSFVTQRDSVLANLPLGYSDGYNRSLGNKGEVIIQGKRVPVVGKISMNTTMVDVTDIEGIRQNAEVVLFGEQGKEAVTISEIETHTDMIFPEIYTIWGNSNPRRYVR